MNAIWVGENNNVINAYANFKTHLFKDISQKLDKKTNAAKNVCENIFSKIRCNSILLKANSIISFDAIIIIPEKDYLSDEFEVVYKRVLSIVNEFKVDGFELDFSFMTSSKNINSKLLKYDGYTWMYKSSARNRS